MSSERKKGEKGSEATERAGRLMGECRMYGVEGGGERLRGVVTDGVGHGGRSRWGSDFDHLEAPATALAPISRGSEITPYFTLLLFYPRHQYGNILRFFYTTTV